jgi:hypothetical protein
MRYTVAPAAPSSSDMPLPIPRLVVSVRQGLDRLPDQHEAKDDEGHGHHRFIVLLQPSLPTVQGALSAGAASPL